MEELKMTTQDYIEWDEWDEQDDSGLYEFYLEHGFPGENYDDENF